MATPAYSESDRETEVLKIPPHNIEAEQAVLGGLFLDPEAFFKVMERLRAEDFYRRDHQIIFNAISRLDADGKPFDVVTTAEWLEDHQQLDEAGGLAYLAALAENTPSASNIVAYADIVRKRSVLRRLLAAANEIGDAVFNPQGRGSEEILDFAEQRVFEIAEREARGRRPYKQIQDLMGASMEQIDKLFKSKTPITGVATGFSDLDERTAGLQKADLIIIAGRTSMGKTAFAINIAEQAAIEDKLTVAVFSMEMPGEQLAMRMMSSLGRVNQQKVRTGKLDDDDWPRLNSAVALLKDAKLFIDDTPALTPAELRARCRRLAREHGGLDLIIIDYLQLMHIPGTTENRATELSTISRSLKAMAKELNAPVVALSQLNRSLDQRPDKRPILSDLRESGAIEQDADLIMFIYRDEVHHPERDDNKGKAEVIIGKQRNGPIGSVSLTFLGQFTRFESHIEDGRYEPGPGL